MFKDFRIDEVFTMKRGKEAAPNRVPDGIYNMVNETSVNNGITKKADSSNIFKGNSITVSVNYATTVFYQPEPFCASVNILILENDNLTPESAMYIIAMLRKNNERYDYNNKISKDKLAETVLSFPVLENEDAEHVFTADDIDWQYMYDKISDLGQEKITELDTYLKKAGLEDYELTDADKEVISLSAKRTPDEDRTLENNCDDEIKFKSFLLKDIAELNYGNKFDKNKMGHAKPSVNFVSRTALNNGVSDCVDNNGTAPFEAGCITLAFGGSVGSCFVQYSPFYTGQNVGVIDFGKEVSFEAKQYIALCLGLYCKTMFTAFADEINKHFKTDLKVKLPVTADGEPNYEYMEKYVKAIEKVVITDVVKYKDKMIKATKQTVKVTDE